MASLKQDPICSTECAKRVGHEQREVRESVARSAEDNSRTYLEVDEILSQVPLHLQDNAQPLQSCSAAVENLATDSEDMQQAGRSTVYVLQTVDCTSMCQTQMHMLQYMGLQWLFVPVHSWALNPKP